VGRKPLMEEWGGGGVRILFFQPFLNKNKKNKIFFCSGGLKRVI
jgi:hypothetical protein